MKLEQSVKLQNLSEFGNKVENLRRMLEVVPENAKFNLSYTSGDRPWELGHFTITFKWEVDLEDK